MNTLKLEIKQAEFLWLFILFLLGVTPAFLGHYLNASSMDEGLFFTLGLIVITHLNHAGRLLKFDSNFLYLTGMLILYGSFQNIIVGPFQLKSYISLVAILIVISVAYFCSKVISENNYFTHRVVYYLTGIMILLLFVSVISGSAMSIVFYGQNKGVFPFGEPSHFALFMGPFFMLSVLFVKKVYFRCALIMSVFFLAIGIGSTTLLVYVFMTVILFIRMSLGSMIVVVVPALFCAYYVFSSEYYLNKIILNSETVNLTALVYLQGIQDGYLALKNTYGLGLGLQMLGFQEPSDVAERISIALNVVDGELNRFDGGFLAAKIVAEWGVVGILILFLYIKLMADSFFRLRKIINGSSNYSNDYVFSLIFIYAAFVEFFVRGVGYFSPSLFLFFTALFIHRKYVKMKWQ